jgi:hypothetical protein
VNSTPTTQNAPSRAAAVAANDIIPGVSTPKALFMLAAGASFVLSVSLFFSGSREQGLFVGLWVPSILSAGALLLGRSGNE